MQKKKIMIKNIVGASVTAENFFGREKELRSGLQKLQNGNSLMLSAPRRVGKTSFAKRIIDLLEPDGWIGVFINMESLKTEEGLYTELSRKLYEKEATLPRLKHGAKNAIRHLSISFKDISIHIDNRDLRQSLRNDIMKVLNDKDNPLKLLFVFDELAVFLHNITEAGEKPEKAKDFLNLLRSIRQECQGQALWIFCSSISIENYLMSHNLSASMNDVLEFPLGEMPENEALGLIEGLAEGAQITISKPTQKHILKRLGLALPYSIQGIFSAIIDFIDGRKQATIKDVDAAYDQLLMNSPHLNTWYERLNEYDEQKTELKQVLRHISQQVGPVSADNLFNVVFVSHEEQDRERLNMLLRILTHDGYIMPDSEGKYSFRMNLLKDYWKLNNL